MEPIVKKYFIRLLVMSIVSGFLSVIFIHHLAGIIVFIVLVIISYFYVNLKSKNPSFVDSLKPEQQKETHKKVGRMGLRMFLILLFIVTAAILYDNLPDINYVMMGISILSFIGLCYSFIKRS